MKLNDAHAKVVGYGFGGNGQNVRLVITLAFEIYLAEAGDGTFADYVFDKIPELFAALTTAHPNPTAEINVPSDQAFDGMEAHSLKLWGLGAGDRQGGARPVIESKAVNVTGKIACKVTHGDEGAVASVKVRLSTPTSMLGDLTARELGTQYKGECWVDLDVLQSEIEPEIRKPAETVEDRQEALSLVGDDDDDELLWWERMEWNEGITDKVVLIAAPDQLLDLVTLLARCPLIGNSAAARRAALDVKNGTPTVVAALGHEDALSLVMMLEEAGGAAHALALGDEDDVDEPFVGDVEEWKPRDDLRDLDAFTLKAYILTLDVDQARRQFSHTTQKATRMSDVERIARKLVKLLNVPAPVDSAPLKRTQGRRRVT